MIDNEIKASNSIGLFSKINLNIIIKNIIINNFKHPEVGYMMTLLVVIGSCKK